MRSNSSRVVKWYSRPSCSEPRGGRVVHETENSIPLSCLRTSLTSVLFPEPEGAEMMKRMPATLTPPSRSLSNKMLDSTIERAPGRPCGKQGGNCTFGEASLRDVQIQ